MKYLFAVLGLMISIVLVLSARYLYFTLNNLCSTLQCNLDITTSYSVSYAILILMGTQMMYLYYQDRNYWRLINFLGIFGFSYFITTMMK